MSYTLLPADQCIVPLPPETFACPICGAALVAGLETWTLAEDGSGWAASDEGLDLECTTEPDGETDEWEPWFDWHYRMPYVDWLPLHAPVLAWINARFRWQRERGATHGSG